MYIYMFVWLCVGAHAQLLDPSNISAISQVGVVRDTSARLLLCDQISWRQVSVACSPRGAALLSGSA